MSAEAINLEAIGSSLSRLERLPIAQKPLRGVLFGDYLTNQVGEGFDLHDLRPYEPGDDWRDINWPATLRSPDDELIVEDHIAENAPAFYLVSDVPSRRYFNDAPEQNERDLGIGIGMLTTLMARRDDLPVSATWSNGLKISRGEEPTFDEVLLADGFKRAVNLIKHADSYAETRQNTKRGLLGFVQKRQTRPEMQPTYLKDLLNSLGGIATTESVIVVVSDFRDVFDPKNTSNGWYRPLAKVADKNQVVAVELTSKWDFELPEGERLFRDPNSGQIISLDNIPNGAARYAEQEQQRAANIANAVRKSGASHIVVDTGKVDWIGHIEQQMDKLRQAA